jgi:hypothetical protein
MDSMLSLENAREYLLSLPRQLDRQMDDQALLELNALLAKFEEFFNIALRIDRRGDDRVVDPGEATEICDFGFILLDKLLDLTARQRLPGRQREIEQLSLVIARWAIRHDAEISDLQPVTQAVARLAESLRERTTLLALSGLLGDIVEHCAPEFKQDRADDDEFPAWLELHVNRGKVAIRSRDADTMKRAFEEFLFYLPEAAPAFLAARMKEAEAREYPAEVRELLADYLGRTAV